MKKAAVVLAVAGMLALTGGINPATKSQIEAGGDWISEKNKPYRCNFVHGDLD